MEGSVDWGQVGQARTQAQQAGQTATEFGARGNTLADELRKAIGERFAEFPIAKEAATARGNFLAAAPQARADVLGLVNSGNILSPTQQNAIMAAKRASALIPVMAANINQEAAFGSLEDLIGAGTNAYKAEADRRAGLAQLAQGNYSSLLNELLQKAQEGRATAEASRASELFPLQKTKLLADIAATNRSNAGGGATATERMTAEKKKLIQEAAKLPEENRKSYILANGYNPNDSDFSGLFTKTGLDVNAAGALEKTGQIGDFTVNPATGRLEKKTTTDSGFIPDWIPFIGRF